jgi:hypothetical protein
MVAVVMVVVVGVLMECHPANLPRLARLDYAKFSRPDPGRR